MKQKITKNFFDKRLMNEMRSGRIPRYTLGSIFSNFLVRSKLVFLNKMVSRLLSSSKLVHESESDKSAQLSPAEDDVDSSSTSDGISNILLACPSFSGEALESITVTFQGEVKGEHATLASKPCLAKSDLLV
jgi:hypothetical protein